MAHITLKSTFLQELEQDNFKPEAFVEKLALKVLGNASNWKPDSMQPEVMRDAMLEVLEELKVLKLETERKMESLETECLDEKQRFFDTLNQVEKKHQSLIQQYQNLDGRVNYVANKVIRLGDQLESVNIPRVRLIEARKLLTFYSEFLAEHWNFGLDEAETVNTKTPLSANKRISMDNMLVADSINIKRGDKESIFKDPNQLLEAADIIQKLYVISQDIVSNISPDTLKDIRKNKLNSPQNKMENGQKNVAKNPFSPEDESNPEITKEKVEETEKDSKKSTKEEAYLATRDKINQIYEQVETNLIDAFITVQAGTPSVLLTSMDSGPNPFAINSPISTSMHDKSGSISLDTSLSTSMSGGVGSSGLKNTILSQEEKLRRIITMLSNFKNYYRCVDAFMEQCQAGAFYRSDLFGEALSLCIKTGKMIESIFPDPQRVYAKFIINVFQGKLNDHIQNSLEDKCPQDIEGFLVNLYDLYTKTQNLCDHLVDVKMGIDDQFLQRLMKNLFGRYLENYISIELKFFKYKCQNLLDRFYDNIRYEKKPISTGGLAEFKRMIGVGGAEPIYLYSTDGDDPNSEANNQTNTDNNNTNLSIDAKNPFDEIVNSAPNTAFEGGGNTSINANKNNLSATQQSGQPLLLVNEAKVSDKMLQLLLECERRSKKLSPPTDVSINAMVLYDVMLDYLYVQHIEYAIDVELQNLLNLDASLSKYYPGFPKVTFLRTLACITRIFLRVQDLYEDHISPLMSYERLDKKAGLEISNRLRKHKKWRENCESKLASGLERYAQMIMTRVKHELTQKQKKTDFNPPQQLTTSNVALSDNAHSEVHKDTSSTGLNSAFNLSPLLSKRSGQPKTSGLLNLSSTTHSNAASQSQISSKTQACQGVVTFLAKQIEDIKSNLDGKNLDNFMLELGIEFHRTILDHFLNYTFNLTGAITAIYDINEYRNLAKDAFSSIPLIVCLFDSLKALVNLLVVPPQNIKQICLGEDLINIDKSMIFNFVQLRADYKSAKLHLLFK